MSKGSRSRTPFEEAEILGMAERLFRQGLDSPDTERERGLLVMATTDMALAKLIGECGSYRAAEIYRSEDCRGECMLKALLALGKANTHDGKRMVNYMVKAVQNRARSMVDKNVRDSVRMEFRSEFDNVVDPTTL